MRMHDSVIELSVQRWWVPADSRVEDQARLFCLRAISSVALIRALTMPGSMLEWPASRMMFNSEFSQLWCSEIA